MALETQGFQFQAPIPDLSREHPLTSLRSLSFSGGTNNPVNIQPLAGWKVESAHPEKVAIGAIEGAGAIGQGITAAYLSKQAKKEAADALAKSQAREDQQLKDKYQSAKDVAILRDHIKATTPSAVVPDYGDNSEDDTSTQTDSGETPIIEKPTFFGEDKETNYLRNTTAATTEGTSVSQNLTSEQSNILANLGSAVFDPSQIASMSASSDTGIPSTPESTLMSDQAASSIFNKYNADHYAMPQVDSQLQKQGAEAMATAQMMPLQKQFGALAQTQAPTPVPSQVGGVPKQGFNSYAKAQRYIDSQSGNPNWYAEGAPKPDKYGKFIVPWKHHDPAAMAAREEAQATRKEASQSRHEIQTQNTLNRETAMFQGHPAIKAFTGANGMQQSLPRFIKDYDAIVKNPEGAGISDVGLLDMFARAEGGGRVTEGQANLALGSMGLKDKAMQLGYKLEGGDRLSQNQRDQMLRVISEDHGVQVSLANQAVQMTRQKLMDQGITNEHSLPQPYIKAKTKWEALDEITEMKKNALAIHEQQKQAEASGDKKTANDLKRQLEDIGKSAKELRSKIDKSKSAIINIDELENTPQGWGGGASGILIQQ